MLSALQPESPRPATPARAPADNRARPAPRRRLCCRVCGNPIADPDDRLERLGSHQHVFVNPHGLDFRVRLFAAAAGARPVGEVTGFYSWFPGYPWQVLVCAGCTVHLGWAWGVPLAFVGLIADRLTEQPDD